MQDKVDETTFEILETIEIIEEPQRHESEGTENLECSSMFIGDKSGPDELQPKSEFFASQFETEDTKGLSNEQLQRIVFLQQIKVLELKHKKLELEVNAETNPVLFDISGLNGLNVSGVLNSN